MCADRLRVVLCWHMHQPDYRDPLDGHSLAPWTYLHAIRSYTDMARHLERAPENLRAVVNLPPLLLEQIADLATRLRRALEHGDDPGSDLLAALAAPTPPRAPAAREALMRRCLQAHTRHMIERFPAFERLARLARLARQALDGPRAGEYMADLLLTDLLTWYHLAWLGETVRREDARIAPLLAQEHGFTQAQRRLLLEVIADLLEQLWPRYRQLAADGRVELSTSPYSHAMLPLLIDFTSAQEAIPGLELPGTLAYPGGRQRAVWQLQQARQSFQAHLGCEPRGCWPSEGGLCAASLDLIAAAGFQWVASGQGVLRNSLPAEAASSEHLHRPYRLQARGPVCFFRDDGLADRIGFTYQSWHGDDAVADCIQRLEHIEAEDGGPDRVVAIILDGENPWEHYPDNGIHFVPALYKALAQHERLRTVTFSDCIDDASVPVGTLKQLVAGSWVHGDFATWIGHPDKNRAWDLLAAAKRLVDQRLPGIEDLTHRDRIEHQLAVCEGSDWFWWLGDINPATAVSAFEALFRHQLSGLYQLLEVAPPAELEQPLSRGGGAAEGGGTMRRSEA